jgi:hypothetical protein
MDKIIYKTIKKENGTITIYDERIASDMYYAVPDWSEDEELAFTFNDNEYFVSEFTRTYDNSDWMGEFHGILNWTYFSGILIKLTEDLDSLRIYTYSC